MAIERKEDQKTYEFLKDSAGVKKGTKKRFTQKLGRDLVKLKIVKAVK